MIKFQKIEQFKNTVRAVCDYVYYKNAPRDEDGKVIEGHPIAWELPTLTFTGKVKLHGTNSSWVYNIESDKLSFQSRNRVLTVEKDNAGFALWFSSQEEKIKAYMKTLANLTERTGDIIVYGEWAGPGIQKGVGISEIPRKSFFIFEIIWKDGDNILYMGNGKNDFKDVDDTYLILDDYTITIDFNKPQLAQQQLIDFTNQVEEECPIAKKLGVIGIGEGIVWSHYIDTDTVLRFKVKGEKHSVSKVKTLAPIDIEKYNRVSEFVDNNITEQRLQQGIDYLNEMEHEISMKSTGHFVKWVTSDVFTEEMDTIVENQLDSKMIGKECSNQARKWFMEQCSKI